MRPGRVPLAATSLAFFASGAAALVYQVAWQRILALHTGVGVYSIAVIVAAFMAGLGVGSHLGGGVSERLSPRRALAAFGLLELAVAAFGAVSVPLYHGALGHAGRLYAHALPAALLHLAALLPPTALMGMSLPFLARATVLDPSRAGRTLGLLYGINMLGAAAGAWLAPWVLVRHAGLLGAVLAAAAANALAGALAIRLAARHPSEPPPAVGAPAPAGPRTEAAGSHPLGLWLALYGASGFCALSLEVLWFRLLDVATRATAFTFGTLLALYLLGTAAGCLAAAGFAPRLRRPLHFFLVCQCVIGAWAGLSVAALRWLPPSTPVLAPLDAFWRTGALFRLGNAADTALLARLYVVLPLALFGVPTVLMGVSFPALQRAVQDDPATAGRKVGRLQAANILGCVAGSLAVGLAGLAWLGTAGSLRAVVLAASVFALAGLRAYGARSAFAPLLLLLLATAGAVPSNEQLWPRLLGVTSTRGLATEDATSLSAVLAFPDGWKVTVNGKHHSRLPFGGVHTRLGALPAIVHPRPAKVAIVGLGSGDTAWAAGCRTETARLVVFEIAAGQRALLERVARRVDLPDLRRLLADPRLAVVTADGRHAIARGQERFDLIEADALWPYAAYAGNLYSVEFFRDCGERLEPGGLMCTWAPTPRVRASFRAAFPHVVGPGDRSILIGSRDPIAIDPEAWAGRAADARIASYLGSERAAEVARVIARLRPLEAGEETDVRPNLDLFPRDEFLTP